MMEYPSGKLGDCSFSRFGSIMRTNGHTHTDAAERINPATVFCVSNQQTAYNEMQTSSEIVFCISFSSPPIDNQLLIASFGNLPSYQNCSMLYLYRNYAQSYQQFLQMNCCLLVYLRLSFFVYLFSLSVLQLAGKIYDLSSGPLNLRLLSPSFLLQTDINTDHTDQTNERIKL